MGNTRKFVITFVLVFATVVVAGLTVRARSALRLWDPERAREHNEPIPVRTVLVSEGRTEEAIGATAVTVPAESATIRVVQGSTVRELLKVHAKLGTPVKEGQLMFEFKPELFAQAVLERKAGLSAAEEMLSATERLYRDKAASGLDLTDAKVKVETARLDLLVAEQDLRDCRIVSPIDGVVADVQAVPGEKVDTTYEITQVHRLNPILVQVDFPQERIDALFVGQMAEVVLDSFPSETFTGRVARISPVADIETRVLPVMVEVENKDNKIKAGLTGFVRIRIPKRGVTAPAAALIQRGSRAMLFKVENDIVRAREVRVGPLVKDGMVEIFDGLRAGEEIVLFGNTTLRDGDRVDTNWHRWANRTR